MAAIVTASTIDLLAAIAACLAVAYLSWRTRPRAGSYALAAFVLVVAAWAVALLLAQLEPASPLYPRLQWLGRGSVAFVWFVFVLKYVGRDELVNRYSVGALLAWPAVLNLLVWLPDVAAAVGVDVVVPFAAGLDRGAGPLFLAHVSLTYGLFAAGTVLLLAYGWRARSVLRREGLAMLVGVGAIWAGVAFAALQPFGDLGVRYEPAGLAVAGVAFLWATARQRLLELLPAVTAAALQRMDTGVIVADEDGRVVDLNRAARDLLDLSERERIAGKPLVEVLSAAGAAPGATQDRADGDPGDPFTLSLGDRVVQVTASRVRTSGGGSAGRIYLCEDVTGRFIQQSELKRKSDRFSEFARIVSNDLRNPLEVAQKQLGLARADVANDYLDHVSRAHGRMESLIDDLLTLVRESDEATALEPVELGDVVKESWGSVDTATATIVVRTNQRIRADRGRLRLLLENLFENAIQHGGDDVTISVGALDGGFYVEDDGPGIHPDSREQVFESGYSTTDVGTGFGLAIVERIADAHGWAVSVTGGSDGGARFELTGIDVDG